MRDILTYRSHSAEYFIRLSRYYDKIGVFTEVYDCLTIALQELKLNTKFNSNDIEPSSQEYLLQYYELLRLLTIAKLTVDSNTKEIDEEKISTFIVQCENIEASISALQNDKNSLSHEKLLHSDKGHTLSCLGRIATIAYVSEINKERFSQQYIENLYEQANKELLKGSNDYYTLTNKLKYARYLKYTGQDTRAKNESLGAIKSLFNCPIIIVPTAIRETLSYFINTQGPEKTKDNIVSRP